MRAILILLAVLLAGEAWAENACLPIIPKAKFYVDVNAPVPWRQYLNPQKAGDGGPAQVWGAGSIVSCGPVVECTQIAGCSTPGQPDFWASLYYVTYGINKTCALPFLDTIAPVLSCPSGYVEIVTGPNTGKCQGSGALIFDALAASEGATVTRNVGNGVIASYRKANGDSWFTLSTDPQGRPRQWIDPQGLPSAVTYYGDSNIPYSRSESGLAQNTYHLPPGASGKTEIISTDIGGGIDSPSTALGVVALSRVTPSPAGLIVLSGIMGAAIGTKVYGSIEPILSGILDNGCNAVPDSGVPAETQKDKEDRCNKQYDRDENVCFLYLQNNYTKPGSPPVSAEVYNWNVYRYNTCKASAMRRLAQCLAGQPIEPLDLIFTPAP